MGIVTDIQRFSLHDGPGIRTSVFLKGCNMRCAWCHNPETLSVQPQLLLYPQKCIGCGHCVAVCKTGAMRNGPAAYDAEKCVSCGVCANVCFSGALEMCGRDRSVEDVLFEAMQDLPYYEKSGGGVTLTGGEVTFQPEFALALLTAFSQKGVSCAIETNLLAPFSVYESFLPYLSLVMFDIKCPDEESYRKWTGAPMGNVLENAKKLDETGVPFLIRTPVIPGVNADAEAIAEIAKIAGSFHNLLYYELLNFNPLGDGKYTALHMENPFHAARPLPDSEMQNLRAAALPFVADVRIG